MNLSKNIKIRKIAAGAAAATTDVEAAVVDMSNYDGCVFITTIAVANAGNKLTILQGDDEIAAVAASHNGQAVYVDVYRPLEEQGEKLQAVIERAASSATGDIYAIQYNGRTKPEVNLVDAANGIKGVVVISPEGE